MSEFLAVRNWTKFQHYKDRCPPWIKLHFDLLTSADWILLPDADKAAMVVCMLVASRNEGKVPNSADYIKRVGYLKRKPNLNALIECGFLEKLQADDSKLAEALASARPETEEYSLRSYSQETEAAELSARENSDLPDAVPVGVPPPSPRVVVGTKVLALMGLTISDPRWYGHTGRVDAWLNSGADPDADIYPTITRIVADRRAADPNWLPRALTYFDNAIADAVRLRKTRLANTEPVHGETKQTDTGKGKTAAQLLAERHPERFGKRLGGSTGADADPVLPAVSG